MTFSFRDTTGGYNPVLRDYAAGRLNHYPEAPSYPHVLGGPEPETGGRIFDGGRGGGSAEACSKCRENQRKSGVFNIMDPCQGVCRDVPFELPPGTIFDPKQRPPEGTVQGQTFPGSQGVPPNAAVLLGQFIGAIIGNKVSGRDLFDPAGFGSFAPQQPIYQRRPNPFPTPGSPYENDKEKKEGETAKKKPIFEMNLEDQLLDVPSGRSSNVASLRNDLMALMGQRGRRSV